MIVQSAPLGSPHFIITQADHAMMSGQFALAFGNAQFEPLTPLAPLVYAIAHHDQGWVELDAQITFDAHTGLPYHLTQTPLPLLVQTSMGSPTFNERYHPLSGLLSSMHTWGLYNGRYGLSDKIFINLIPPEHKPSVQNMLDGELARQARLKLASAHQATWVDESFLLHNYKLLQFFDTLALYFHTTHASQRTATSFLNVPQAIGRDVTIALQPIAENTARLSPYPFRAPQLEVTVVGRYLTPQSSAADLFAQFLAAPLSVQSVVLVA
ncbi:MAG TPA: DUF3891 family protein [Anaerolineales bacterium]|nr:DUF3891 family protein [Anaerolineales bacterium]